MRTKRTLGILLTLAMLFGLLALAPITANAAVAPSDPTITDTWYFTNVDEDGSGTGYGGVGTWEWDQDTLTLTLTNINHTTSAITALQLPNGAKLALNGANTITSTAAAVVITRGIHSDNSGTSGTLTITGPGSLNATSGSADSTLAASYGISCSSLTISSGATITATGGATLGSSVSISSGISTLAGSVTVSGGSTVTATGGTANGSGVKNSYGITGSLTVSSDATVTATGETSAINPDYTVQSGFTYYRNTSTAPDATSYQGNGTSTIISSTHKYAKIEGTLYTMAYDENGGGAGTAPTGENKYKGDTFAAAAATGMTAPAGQKFKEWNTLADGTGTTYAAGATVTMPADNLTLYAIWADAFGVTYALNGGSGSVPTETDKAAGETFTVKAETGMTAPAGQQFDKWNTAANGSGTSYAAGATVTMPAGALTLYAIWKAIPTGGGSSTYSVTYDLNSGTGTAPTESAKEAGATFTAPTAAGLTASAGKRFKEWNTQKDGKGTGYKAGEQITMTAAALKLYAIWEDIPASSTYAVTYDLNGGTGAAPTQADQEEGAAFTAPAATGLIAPAGKRFKEWNTAKDGTGDGYASSATVTMPAGALTLYAIWEDIPVDKTALNARVDEIDDTQKGNHTDDSWDAFQNALAAAQAVAKDANATQAQVDGALATLNTAFGNLAVKMIFSTHYESNFWNWVKFILLFGWAWMWFI